VAAISLRSRLLLALAYVLVLAVVALEVPLILSLRDRVDAEVRSQARGQADLIAATVSGSLEPGPTLDEVVSRAGTEVRGRVIAVGAGGRLLADSAGEDRLGLFYGDRPEIERALQGGFFQEERRSETLDNQAILATAVPVLDGDRVEGAVRITQRVGAISSATDRATLGLIAVGALVLVLGLAAGALIARQVSGPLRRLDAAARRIGEGDLTARAKVEGSAEQQRLARTFNQMTERVERLVTSQRDFVADASHQLRTPLSGLRLRLEEAYATTSEPEAREEIEAGLREVDRLSAMVAELLLLSQAGEIDAPPEKVDLEDAAYRAAARWDGATGGKVVASGTPSEGYCSIADLDRALDVLLENALHYGNGEVEVRSRPGALEVLDRGPGLSDADLEAVFERFHRGSAGRSGPTGTGLGLPIARELAQRWGGDVTLANRNGGGARATLTVPAFPEA
jgi:two-component system, OmpR family, sensor kinase